MVYKISILNLNYVICFKNRERKHFWITFNSDGSNELMLRTLTLLVMTDILVDVQQLVRIVSGHFQSSPKVRQIST